jgi:hypothetical protein
MIARLLNDGLTNRIETVIEGDAIPTIDNYIDSLTECSPPLTHSGACLPSADSDTAQHTQGTAHSTHESRQAEAEGEAEDE